MSPTLRRTHVGFATTLLMVSCTAANPDVFQDLGAVVDEAAVASDLADSLDLGSAVVDGQVRGDLAIAVDAAEVSVDLVAPEDLRQKRDQEVVRDSGWVHPDLKPINLCRNVVCTTLQECCPCTGQCYPKACLSCCMWCNQ